MSEGRETTGTGPLSDPRRQRSNRAPALPSSSVNSSDPSHIGPIAREPVGPHPPINDRPFADLAITTFHHLLRLRVDVFVVEQTCAYPELDGRDTEPETRHVWLDGPDGRPVALIRVLAEPDGSHRISRVVTRVEARSAGLAGVLLDHVHATTPGRLVLDAQTYLVPWYDSLGYEATGGEFLEDGIPHVPMAREGAQA